MNYTCTQCIRWEHQSLLAAHRGQLGGGGSGPRLAELREQACNTDQGDLVMDIRLTESPLCLLNICVECKGSSWLSPTMADSVLKKSAKCCCCILCSPVCVIKSHKSNLSHIVSAQTAWLRQKNKHSLTGQIALVPMSHSCRTGQRPAGIRNRSFKIALNDLLRCSHYIYSWMLSEITASSFVGSGTLTEIVMHKQMQSVS